MKKFHDIKKEDIITLLKNNRKNNTATAEIFFYSIDIKTIKWEYIALFQGISFRLFLYFNELSEKKIINLIKEEDINKIDLFYLKKIKWHFLLRTIKFSENTIVYQTLFKLMLKLAYDREKIKKNFQKNAFISEDKKEEIIQLYL
ncbi:hypothetical protein [Campylobacter canadensis]|uniref:hypothetical protein n=1 Tax=Campylobacter canadensis TaxID=449520 RepID=UPI001CCBB237|nr:hypothetical protein [Campylobacter canadensis]MBZ8002364.1 hypothetical protein [Campylobacter canadensis]